MKPLLKTRLAAGAGILAAILLLFFWLRPAPVPVDSGKASIGPLQVTLEAEGVTRVVERFTVAAPVSGRLLRSSLEEGERVDIAQTLALIVPPGLNTREFREASALAASARALLGAAETRRRQLEINLAQSRRRAARYDQLYREGAVSKESWELARNEAAVLEKERQAAASALASAAHQYEAAQARVDPRLALKPVAVTSPASGMVLRIHEKSEKVVTAGMPLFDIGDPGRLEIVIDLLSADAVRIRPGQAVLIEGWGGEGSLCARVSRVEPAAFTKISALGIEEKRVNIIAQLEHPEPRLGDNFRVLATIVLHDAAQVLRVPVSSLYRSGDGWRVFVIVDGRAVERKVAIGMRGSSAAEVLGGLRPGERVVLHPANELGPGMRVSEHLK